MKTPRLLTMSLRALAIGALLSLSSAIGGAAENKANDPVIPKLELREATPAVAFKAITSATGIKVFYAPAAGEDAKITVSMANVPASEAFRYIAALANLKFSYEKDGVHVTAR